MFRHQASCTWALVLEVVVVTATRPAHISLELESGALCLFFVGFYIGSFGALLKSQIPLNGVLDQAASSTGAGMDLAPSLAVLPEAFSESQNLA